MWVREGLIVAVEALESAGEWTEDHPHEINRTFEEKTLVLSFDGSVAADSDHDDESMTVDKYPEADTAGDDDYRKGVEALGAVGAWRDAIDEDPDPVEHEVDSTEDAASVVSGTVTYRERIAMPRGATITVTLEDTSPADVRAKLIGEQLISEPGNVPVSYDQASIDDRSSYTSERHFASATGWPGQPSRTIR